MATNDRHPLLGPRVILRGLVMIAALLAVGWLIEGIGLKSMFETGWIDSRVRGQGLAGEILFVLMGGAFTAIGMPRQVVSFLGGYAFGFLAGTGLGLVATLAGALASFWFARFMGREFLTRRFPGKVRRIDDFLAGNTLAMILVLRLSPFTHNLTTNLAAGISGARPAPFFAASALGYLPQTLIFALLGSGFQFDPLLRTALSVALFVVSTILGLWLWRRTRRGIGPLPEDGSGSL